jgi:hypothetical protein
MIYRGGDLVIQDCLGVRHVAKMVLTKEATPESWSERHCQGAVPSLSYTTLMPLTTEAIAAIGRTLSNHN